MIIFYNYIFLLFAIDFPQTHFVEIIFQQFLYWYFHIDHTFYAFFCKQFSLKTYVHRTICTPGYIVYDAILINDIKVIFKNVILPLQSHNLFCVLFKI